MNKKILFSLLTVGVVVGAGIAATRAFFSDTEKSTGNVLSAGAVDLKVDHLKQTYNDIDCNTCTVGVISDPTNMVVAKNGSPVPSPFPAVYAWVHPVWTAQNDPTLAAAGAKWIWPTNPTTPEDAALGVTYKFQKKFEWWGPITASDLWFGVGSDNSVEVWLNGVKIGENLGEFGYKQESMLHIPGTDVTSHIAQGDNTLEFIVNNFPRPGQDGYSNPGGLIYKFEIDGNCENDYFKGHCQLWGDRDLTTEKFFNFDDIKPGDWGTNVISLHVFDNDSWACMVVNNKQDNENTLVKPEEVAGDTTPGPSGFGELSQFIKVFVWDDVNHDGIYNPPSEAQLFSGSLLNPVINLPVADSTTPSPIPGNGVKYVGLAWCAGTQTVAGDGTITCDGSTMGNIAQTDSLLADLTAYAVQWRHNLGFKCANLVLPSPSPTATP